jgi:hypothetical protein
MYVSSFKLHTLTHTVHIAAYTVRRHTISLKQILVQFFYQSISFKRTLMGHLLFTTNNNLLFPLHQVNFFNKIKTYGRFDSIAVIIRDKKLTISYDIVPVNTVILKF